MVGNRQGALKFSNSENRGVTSSFDENSDSHVIWTGDSLELLKSIPDSSVQLVVTSPPYNIGKIYENPTSLEEYLENQFQLKS